MSPIPQYIGANAPQQVVKIRLGRLSRYYQDNPVHNAKEGEEPDGAGHQTWTGPTCLARVGRASGIDANPYFAKPWQALWIPTSEYVTVPNILEVKRDKKLEGQVGGIGTATVEIDNILYRAAAEGFHERQRGAMSPLRGYYAHGDAIQPDMPQLIDELERIVEATEWEGRFAYAAQITVWEGYGAEPPKTFTGLIEDVDSTSHPDKITLTCRDFGQIFTETHFFGWGKDPVIDTPVVFVDEEYANEKQDVGYNAHASMEDTAGKHTANRVLDFNEQTSWQTNTVHSAEQTEYIEIALAEGVYRYADIAALFAGMDVYVSLRPSLLTGGLAPTRERPGHAAEDLTEVNQKLDKNGWYDPTEKEEQIVPGTEGGNSYASLTHEYPTGQQQTPIQKIEGQAVKFRVGKNSVLRLSFRKLHKIEAGENFRAGIKEFHGLYEGSPTAEAMQQWVVTKDIADIIRIICQWAGFKEWDIPDTGAKLPKQLVYYQDKSWMDAIKEVCEGIGFTFFLADPTAGEGSIGVPTFRKTRVLSPDSEAFKAARAAGNEPVMLNGVQTNLPNRGSTRTGLPNQVVTDRELLTAIQLKQSNEPFSYVIRVYGITQTRPGNAAAGVQGGKIICYTFRPPWTGSPPYYHDTRLGGILKQLVHKDPFFSTTDLCRNAAWFIALMQAIESVHATIQVPALVGVELDDHIQLMDLGTGITTRLHILGRSSSFVDGEKRKYVMTLEGVLIDTPDVRDMASIINGEAEANGGGGVWVDPRKGSGSGLGYGA